MLKVSVNFVVPNVSFAHFATVTNIGLVEGDGSPIPLFEVARSPYDASTLAVTIRDIEG
jgi:hypothetical protein